jgi:hypothetical protein
MNWDGIATTLSGSKLEFAPIGFAPAEPAIPSAGADRQQRENTEATAKTERQRGILTAGFLSEPVTANPSGSSSRRAGTAIYPRIALMQALRCDCRSVFQIPSAATITQPSRLSKQFRQNYVRDWPNMGGDLGESIWGLSTGVAPSRRVVSGRAATRIQSPPGCSLWFLELPFSQRPRPQYR